MVVMKTSIARCERTWIAGLCAAWVCISAVATAADAGNTFLQNSSFEAVAPAKTPPKENERGKWVLKSDLQVSVQWTLSSAFPGELEVIEEDGTADGQQFLRVAAGLKRAAHLYQHCPRLRRGLAYEVSLRYRGGPVELKVYEYDGTGKLKANRAFAKCLPTPEALGICVWSNPWHRTHDWATISHARRLK